MLWQSLRETWRVGIANGPPWLGMLLSIGAFAVLAWLLVGSDWTEIKGLLVEADLRWLAAGVLSALGVPVAKTIRWGLLLGRDANLQWLLSLVLRTRLVNSLVPMRLGDVWRVVEAARAPQLGPVRAVGSVVVDKALDGVAILCLGSLVAASSGYGSLVAALFALGAFSVALATRLLAPGRKLARWTEEWSRWSGPLRRWPLILGVSLTTIMGITLGLLANGAVLLSLGFPVEWATAVAMLIAGYAAGVVPAGPGRFGVFEAAVVAPLVAIGMAGGDALAVALLLHAVVLVDATVGAIIGMVLGLVPSPTSP